MHFYSPRAYQFLRDKFNKHLPSKVTLRKWYANCTSEGEPGISKESLKTLAALAENFKMQGRELVVSISFDEMSIRRMVQWNDAKKRFYGYISHGEFETENIPVARNALVFLVTGLNADFSLPLAHYFVIALKGTEKALLIKDIVTEITNLKIRIANLTFDGLQSNISACKALGASFDILNMKPYILNPNSNKIHILLDACHMLKVARNCIATEKFIHNRASKKTVSWVYFERLEACRNQKNFICHKLTKKHMQWYRSKMDVRLAAETLSDSVANSMEHLMNEGIKSFEHCDETIVFTRIMNKLFDVFNSKKEKEGNIFKSPLTMTTKRIIYDFLGEAEAYLKSLTLHGRSILLSQKKTAFKGMLINILSLKAVVAEYVDTGIIESLPTFKMSQDPLESLFGRIRSLNGNNDNPNIEQFSSALRKLLVHNEIQSSDLSNCRDQLNILTISSFKKKDPETLPSENNNNDENSADIHSFQRELFSANDNLLDVFN